MERFLDLHCININCLVGREGDGNMKVGLVGGMDGWYGLFDLDGSHGSQSCFFVRKGEKGSGYFLYDTTYCIFGVMILDIHSLDVIMRK